MTDEEKKNRTAREEEDTSAAAEEEDEEEGDDEDEGEGASAAAKQPKEEEDGDDEEEDGGDDEEDDEDDEDDEDEDDEEDEEDEEEKEADPEAIAKRVAALGGDEDELDKIAREEEAKLQKRRRGAGKRGLQKAASKKLRKIAAKAPRAKRPIASAIPAADPLLERTAKLGEWARENQKVVSIVVGLGLIGAAIFGSVQYLDRKKANEASATLAVAVADQRGRIGEDTEDDPDRPKDTTPIFKTADERREAALGKYREVTTKFPGTGASTLARLAEGSLLLDKRDPDGAAGAFLDVKGSPLAQADAEVRGRALEGLGFAYELKAQLDANQKDKHLDDALKQFRELENTDIKGFKELGMYHQGRVYEAKGDKAKAIEELKSLHERLVAPGENHPMRYLEEVAEDRLRALDPTALPPKPQGMLGGPGGNNLTEAQMRKLIEQLQKQQGQHP